MKSVAGCIARADIRALEVLFDRRDGRGPARGISGLQLFPEQFDFLSDDYAHGGVILRFVLLRENARPGSQDARRRLDPVAVFLGINGLVDDSRESREHIPDGRGQSQQVHYKQKIVFESVINKLTGDIFTKPDYAI